MYMQSAAPGTQEEGSASVGVYLILTLEPVPGSIGLPGWMVTSGASPYRRPVGTVEPGVARLHTETTVAFSSSAIAGEETLAWRDRQWHCSIR